MRAASVPALVLEHWWLCGRKRAYPTRTVVDLYLRAHREAPGWDGIQLHPYLCPYAVTQDAHHWHIGHPVHPRPRRPSVARHLARQGWNKYVHGQRSRWVGS